MNDMAKRPTSFDIAKAVALIAVVVGHCSFAGVPQGVVKACYSFHMPLFFIVSGYFFKQQEDERALLRKSVSGLLVPYLGTSLILIVLMVFRTIFDGGLVVETVRSWTVAALYGSGAVLDSMPEGVMAIGAIWFLLALFWSRLLLNAALKTDYPALVCLALFIVGIGSADSIWLPLAVQPAMCAVLFLYIGFKIKESSLLRRGGMSPILWGFSFCIWLYCARYHGVLYMVSNTYAAGAMDVIGGVCGSICLLKLSEVYISKIPVLSSMLKFVGKNSLAFFCMHLVELDVIRWDLIWEIMSQIPHAWVLMVLMQVACTGLFAGVVYCLPPFLSGLFYPARRAKSA